MKDLLKLSTISWVATAILLLGCTTSPSNEPVTKGELRLFAKDFCHPVATTSTQLNAPHSIQWRNYKPPRSGDDFFCVGNERSGVLNFMCVIGDAPEIMKETADPMRACKDSLTTLASITPLDKAVTNPETCICAPRPRIGAP